jgi:pullulanase/glycogen debranching enzyme
MGRRLIVDSVKYWMREYHVDGFRFDLATLIDMETLEAVRDAALEINPNAILIAEPWGGPYDPAGLSDIGWASWNDQIRNGVKGRNPREPLPKDGPGFMFGRFEGNKTNASLRSFVTGTLREDGGLFVRREHSINYLESHDDNTMGDYVRMATGAVGFRQRPHDAAANAKLTPKQLAVSKLGALFLLTSQGPVMLAEGQEWGRSKLIVPGGVDDPLVGTLDDNSYNKDNATNYLDYRQARLNSGLVEYYRGLLAIRKTYPAFASAPTSAVHFTETGDPLFLVYEVAPAGAPERLLVLLNGNPGRDATITLPEGRWKVLADAVEARPRPAIRSVQSRVIVPPSSGMILVRTR